MHGNESSENYLETILILSERLPVVRSIDIATELNFKKSSVSVAMKKLRGSGHIVVSPEGYIKLTEKGKQSQTVYMKDTHCCPRGWRSLVSMPRQQQMMPAGLNM